MSNKQLRDMNPIELLTLALTLAITAPKGMEASADALVQSLADGMSRADIEKAKLAVA